MKIQTSSQQVGGLFDILQKIKTKPGMYLGQSSVEHLFMFLVGYKTARRELGIELTQLEEEFCSEFQPWLQQKFGVQTVKSWAFLISQHSPSETVAFHTFFQLLDEFLHRQSVALPAAVPTEQRGLQEHKA